MNLISLLIIAEIENSNAKEDGELQCKSSKRSAAELEQSQSVQALSNYRINTKCIVKGETYTWWKMHCLK